MDQPPAAGRFVGIDVARDRVEVHVRPHATAFVCTTDPQGLAKLISRLAPLQPRLIALEASGGYEGVVAATAASASVSRGGSRPQAAEGGGAAAAALNRRSTQTTLQQSSRPLTLKTVAPSVRRE
jgi:transposase